MAGRRCRRDRRIKQMKIPKSFATSLGVAAATLFLGACTVLPTGPSMLVLPGTGRSMESFRHDDNECRQYAYFQIGGTTTQEAANQAAVGSAVVGTAIGAAAGAAIGGSQGAAVGAGVGLAGGSAVGVNSAYVSGYGTQRQYDNAYIQCMYAKGHRVPVPANMAYPQTVRGNGTATGADIPPPPLGTPPPPPSNLR